MLNSVFSLVIFVADRIYNADSQAFCEIRWRCCSTSLLFGFHSWRC